MYGKEETEIYLLVPKASRLTMPTDALFDLARTSKKELTVCAFFPPIQATYLFIDTVGGLNLYRRFLKHLIGRLS